MAAACFASAAAPARVDAATPTASEPAVVERRVAAMGTGLTLTIEASTRAEALAASEAALRAIEGVERRLSTWRDDSELARLNRSTVGAPIGLSTELAAELATALHWSRATDGAFDPAIGALVRAWDLRGAGRAPTEHERSTALASSGSARTWSIDGAVARRLDATSTLEEGGFGKGAGLDAALGALATTAAARATLEFGGQIAWFDRSYVSAIERASGSAPHAIRDDSSSTRGLVACDVADPRDRARRIAILRTQARSASTSGNSEHARDVAGVRHGHLLDPRSGDFARDFGSVTVLADRAIDADCLSTGLFVLGPERALAFAAAHPSIDVLVVEALDDGALRLRASAGLAGRIELLDPRAHLDTNVLPAPAHDAASR